MKYSVLLTSCWTTGLASAIDIQSRFPSRDLDLVDDYKDFIVLPRATTRSQSAATQADDNGGPITRSQSAAAQASRGSNIGGHNNLGIARGGVQVGLQGGPATRGRAGGNLAGGRGHAARGRGQDQRGRGGRGNAERGRGNLGNGRAVARGGRGGMNNPMQQLLGNNYATVDIQGHGVLRTVSEMPDSAHQSPSFHHIGPQFWATQGARSVMATGRVFDGETRTAASGTRRVVSRVITGPEGQGNIRAFGGQSAVHVEVGESSYARAEIFNHEPGELLVADADVVGSGEAVTKGRAL